MVDTAETSGEDRAMSRKTHTPEYRAHLISLARQGRSADSLARDFEPTAPTIRSWVQAADDADRGPIAEDKDVKIRSLERENATLREEREILKKAAAWFAAETGSVPKTGSRS